MPAIKGSRIVRCTSALLYARPRAFVRPKGRAASLRLLRGRLRLRGVGAAHVNYLGAEGLERVLDGGVSLGALAQEPLLAQRLVLGREPLVLRLARRARLDLDADPAPQSLTTDLVQEPLVLRPPQRVVEVFRLGRELDAHLVAHDPHEPRAVERRGEQRLAARFEPALEARRVVVRPEAHPALVRSLSVRLRRRRRDE